MEHTEDLAEFVQIVNDGSVSAAARTLGLPRATLSRRLARLEERLSVRLLHRNTRRLVPTPAGRELYRRAVHILDAAREATEAVRRLDGTPRGLLRVSTPPIGRERPLADVLLSFVDRFPEVELELFATARHVDLVADGFDVALRGGVVRDPALVVRRLRESPIRAWASRDYLARKGTPEALDDLADHVCVCGYNPVSLKRQRHWPLRDGGTVEVHGRIATNDLGVGLEVARRGQGIALIPGGVMRVREDVEALVQVLPDLIGEDGAMSIVYPDRKYLDPKVRAFVDHMVEGVASLGL